MQVVRSIFKGLQCTVVGQTPGLAITTRRLPPLASGIGSIRNLTMLKSCYRIQDHLCININRLNVSPNSVSLMAAPKPQVQPVRTRVYQSWQSSRPKTVRSVPQRFKRLGNGLWIRTRAGRHKHLWKKSGAQKQRMKTHVVCNKRQSWLLERMVGKFWKRHRHYPNDPYAPYHVRNNYSNDRIYRKAPFYP